MWKVCAKMVPRLLNDDQKERRMQMCQDIIKRLQNEPNLLPRVITGDETWIFEYDLKTKCQSSPWKSLTSPRPKKAGQSKSKVKVVLITFFDVTGIVRCAFLPQDQTINQQVFIEILRRLLRSVREKRLELWHGKLWSPSSRGSSRGPVFENVEATKRAVTTELRGIPEESFQQCIEARQRRMEKCTRLKGITLKMKPCKLLFGLEINCL